MNNGLWKKSLALLVALTAIATVFIVGNVLADNTITVNQVSAITNQSIGSTTVAATVAVGHSQTITAPSAPAGYQLTGAATQQLTVTGTNDQVNFYYTQTSYGSIAVNYQDQSGAIVATTYLKNLPYGNQTVSPSAPTGYTLAAAATAQTVNISLTNLNATVTFPVNPTTPFPVTPSNPNPATTILVNYVYNGNTIASEPVNVYQGYNYIYPKDSSSLPALAGYQVANPAPIQYPASNALGAQGPPQGASVTFTLTAVTNQMVNFIYVDLTTNKGIVNTLTGYAFQTSPQPLTAGTPAQPVTSMNGTSYQYPTITDTNGVTYAFDHMVKDGNTVSAGNIPLSGAKGMQNVYLYYKPTNLQEVDIKLQATDGTPLGDTKQYYPLGAPAVIYAPDLAGYNLSSPIRGYQTISVGTTGTSGNTVTFIYSSAVTLGVTLNYQDNSGATLQASANITNGLSLGANDLNTICTHGELSVSGYVLQTPNLVVNLTADAPTATLTLVYTKDVATITYRIYAKNAAGNTKELTVDSTGASAPVTVTVPWNGNGTEVPIAPLSMDATGYATITGAPEATSAALTVSSTSGAGTNSPAANVIFDPSNPARSYTLDFYYNQPALQVVKTLTANGTTIATETLTDLFYGPNSVSLLDSTTMPTLPAGYTYSGGDGTGVSQTVNFDATTPTTQYVYFALTQADLTINVQVNKYTDGTATTLLVSPAEVQPFTNQYNGYTLNYGGNYIVAANAAYGASGANGYYETMPYVAGSTLSTQRTIDLTGYVLKPDTNNPTASYTFSPVAGDTATYTMTAAFNYIPDTKVTVKINKLLPDGNVDSVLVNDTTKYVNVPFGDFTMTATQVADLLTAHGVTAPAGYTLELPNAPLTLSTTQTTGTYTVNYALPNLEYVVDPEQTNSPGTLLANLGSAYAATTYGPLSYGTQTIVPQDLRAQGYTFNSMEVSSDGGITWTPLATDSSANNQGQITFSPTAQATAQTIQVRINYDLMTTDVLVNIEYPYMSEDYHDTTTSGYVPFSSVRLSTVAGSTNSTSSPVPFMTWTSYTIDDPQAFLDEVQAALADKGVNFGPYIAWPGTAYGDSSLGTALGPITAAWADSNSGTPWVISTDGHNPTGTVEITLLVNNPMANYVVEFYRQYNLVTGGPVPGANPTAPPGDPTGVMVYPYVDSASGEPVYLAQNSGLQDRFPANGLNEWTLTNGNNHYALYVPAPINQVVTQSGAYGDFLKLSTNIADYTSYTTGPSVDPLGSTDTTYQPDWPEAFKITDTLLYVPNTQYTVNYEVPGTAQPVLTQQMLYFDPNNAPTNVSVLGDSSFTDANGTLADIPTALTTSGTTPGPGYVSQVYAGTTPVTGNIKDYLKAHGYMLADPTQGTLSGALTDGSSVTVNLVPYQPKIYINVWDKTTGELIGSTSTDAITSANNTALPIPDYLLVNSSTGDINYTYAGTASMPTAGVNTTGANTIPDDLTVQQATGGGYQLVNKQSPGSPIADADVDQYIDLYYVPSSGTMSLSVYSVESDGSAPTLRMGPDTASLSYGQATIPQVIDLQTITTADLINNYALANVVITKNNGTPNDPSDDTMEFYNYNDPAFADDMAAAGYSLTGSNGVYTFKVNSATEADYGMQVTLNFARLASNVVINYQYLDTATNSWITGYTAPGTLAQTTLADQSVGAAVYLPEYAPATVNMLVNNTPISFTRIDNASSQDPAISSAYPSYTVTASPGVDAAGQPLPTVINVRYQPTTPGTIHVKLVDYQTGAPIPIYPLNAVNDNGDTYTVTGIVGSVAPYANAVNLGNLPLPGSLSGTFLSELTKQGFVLMGNPSQSVSLPDPVSGATSATVTFKALQTYGATIKVVYQDVTSAPNSVTDMATNYLYQLPFQDGYQLLVPQQYESPDGNAMVIDPSSISVVTVTNPATDPVSVTTDTYGDSQRLTFNLLKVPDDVTNNLYTVYVGYTQKPHTITIDVWDQANNPLGDPYNILALGNQYTLDVINQVLKDHPGYALAPHQPDSVTVPLSSTSAGQNISVQLVEKLCSIEIIYLNTADNSIIKREVIPANYNQDYVLTPATLPGYQAVPNQSVTVNFAPTEDVLQRIRTVTFAYTPVIAQGYTIGRGVQVYFVTSDGTEVYSEAVPVSKYGPVTINSADFMSKDQLAAYTLAAGQIPNQNVTLTPTVSVANCTFVVEQKMAPVTIQYVVVDSAGNQVQVLGTQTTSCPVGTTTDLSAASYIDLGYLPVDQTITVRPLDETPQTVTFRYTQAPASVSAQAVITDNGVAGAPVDISSFVNIPANPQVGVQYTIQAPDLATWPGPGYVLDSPASVAVTPDASNSYQAKATFNYTKQYYSVTVQGVNDDNSNAAPLYTENSSLPYGLSTAFSALDAADSRVQGYTLVGMPNQTVDVTQNNTTVTFHYKENDHGYIINYVDTTNGGNTPLLSNTVTVGANGVAFSAYNEPITVPAADSVYVDSNSNTTYRLVSQSATTVTPTPADPYPVVTCSYQQFTGININAAFYDVNSQQWVVVPLDTWDLSGDSIGDIVSYQATDHSVFTPVRYNGNLYTVYQPVNFVVQLTSNGPMYFDSVQLQWENVPLAGLTFNCNWLSVDPLRSVPALMPLSTPLNDDQPAVGPDTGDQSTVSPDTGDTSAVTPDSSDSSAVSTDTGDQSAVSTDSSDQSAVSADTGDQSAVSTDSGDASAASADSGSTSAGGSDSGSSATSGSDSGSAAAGGSDSGSSSAGAE